MVKIVGNNSHVTTIKPDFCKEKARKPLSSDERH